MRRAVFVFDFDGVVCDSTEECMITSWNAWEKWHGRSGFRSSTGEFSEENKSRFRMLRPRVRGAGEYYIVLRALAENVAIVDRAGYERLGRRWRKCLEPFQKIFYEMRNRLRQEDLGAWIDLHVVYPDVIGKIKQLHGNGQLYVATLKDGESVRLILGRHGIQLRKERLLDQAGISTKLQALDRIRAMEGCEKKDMAFLDDNYTHLLEPKRAGYRVWMTTWGPTLPEYLACARQEGIPTLGIADVSQLERIVSPTNRVDA